jgi:repressor LexA
MSSLSPRQAEICQFIADFHRKRGYSPTFRDIAASVGVSLGTAAAHIRALKNKGAVTWENKTARSIRIVK